MIDTHAHLDGCDEPAAFLVERARAVGVSRIVTIGTGIASCRAALAIASAEEGVVAALGIDPHQAGSPDAERVSELVELLAHPAAVAVGEIGLDYFHDRVPRAVQLASFDRQLEIASSLGLPVVIHTRDADDDTAAALASFTGRVVLHCFSAPGLLDTAVDRGYYVSFAGNVTYPKASALREAAAAVPLDRLLAETDSPYLAPQPLRGKRNEPANVLHTLAVLAETRGEEIAMLEAQIDRNASTAFGTADAVTVPAPKKSLGQHFLVDDNILGVIARLAELDSGDIVLEIGPGLGALTAVLAERCAHVHTVELDRRLEPHLREIAASPHVSLHWGDALKLDLGAFDPIPTKLVANLPYNVATPIVAESLDRLPTIELWCVMVQREVADRFFAVPSTKAYGAVSVLIQLAAVRTGFHPVGRSVFRPPPNVDSALVAFRRTPLPDDFSRIRTVVEGAFAHRRKTLANSLQLADVTSRERAAAALTGLGIDPSVRAEALAPPVFVELTRSLA